MNQNTRPASAVAFIATILIMVIIYTATKYINIEPNFLERIYVDSGGIFYISLKKPSAEDYDWSLEYDKNYAVLLDKKTVIPIGGSLGGLQSREVYKFASTNDGIIYIIANYPKPSSPDNNFDSSKIFEIRVK